MWGSAVRSHEYKACSLLQGAFLGLLFPFARISAQDKLLVSEQASQPFIQALFYKCFPSNNYTLVDGSESNLNLRVEPPTFWFVDDLLYIQKQILPQLHINYTVTYSPNVNIKLLFQQTNSQNNPKYLVWYCIKQETANTSDELESCDHFIYRNAENGTEMTIGQTHLDLKELLGF